MRLIAVSFETAD